MNFIVVVAELWDFIVAQIDPNTKVTDLLGAGASVSHGHILLYVSFIIAYHTQKKFLILIPLVQAMLG